MSWCDPAEPDVFTVGEVARAAGVPPAHVHALLAASGIRATPGGYVLFDDAVRLVRWSGALNGGPLRGGLFTVATVAMPRRRTPILMSGALHGVVVLVVVALTGVGGRTAAPVHEVQEPPRLVFLVTPGAGGGGGGGGQRQSLAPRAAQLKGRSTVASPVSVARRVEPQAAERPVAAAPQPDPPPTAQSEPEPPVAPPAATPPVTAPVVTAANDEDDEAGVFAESVSETASRGPGEGDGTGSGRGSGIGDGDGAGIGAGSGGGTGGGPYRPGSGITPPGLQREVKPVYTEEARRRGVEGDVLLEVVVRTDGTVGSVRVVRSLGAGLDERAVEAVRQWLFSPARRLGTAVDVLVEIAVEFRLR